MPTCCTSWLNQTPPHRANQVRLSQPPPLSVPRSGTPPRFGPRRDGCDRVSRTKAQRLTKAGRGRGAEFLSSHHRCRTERITGYGCDRVGGKFVSSEDSRVLASTDCSTDLPIDALQMDIDAPRNPLDLAPTALVSQLHTTGARPERSQFIFRSFRKLNMGGRCRD